LLGAEIQDWQLEHRGSAGSSGDTEPGAVHATVARGPGGVRQPLLGEVAWGYTARSERPQMEEVRAARLGLGSALLPHAGRLEGAATGVGGLAARAPWRPPVSHWPALPIKAATCAPRPFQHLPVLDSARRLQMDFPSVFYRTWRMKRRSSGWENCSVSLSPLSLCPAPPSCFPTREAGMLQEFILGRCNASVERSPEDKEDGTKSESSKNSQV
jgi:hypothetical protein